MADESDFHIPEPPPGIGQGFLADLWRLDRPLPRMEGPTLALHHLKRGFDTVASLPTSNIVTIITIAVSLFLFSAFLLVIRNVDKVLTEAGSSLNVSAYLREDASDDAVNTFVQDLESSPWVRSLRYVSKEQALQSFREELGVHGGFLDGLEGHNPLPASIDLTLQPDELGIGNIEKSVERLRRHPLIEDVVYGSEWVQEIESVVRLFRLFGYASLSVVLGLVVFLIANTIRLVIFSRRDEISIMQLVGATSSFVRIPFIIGGVIQGLTGSVVAMIFLSAGFWLLNYELSYSTLFGVALPNLVFLDSLTVAAIIILGVVVGAAGSSFALRRFMDV